MKFKELNIMSNIKMIDNLKAELICVIGQLFRLLTKGANVAQNAILECISGAIIILYVLGEKLGYSYKEIDDIMKEKISVGIKSEDEVEKEGKSLSKLKNYLDKERE